MRATLKSLHDISNLYDLRLGARSKSAKPALPTTAVLGLYMRRNEKMRLEEELKRIRKRRVQIRKHLKDVDREMSNLFIQAQGMAEKLRGNKIKDTKRSRRVVVGY